MRGVPQIRQGDSVARSGGRFDSSRDQGKKHGALDLNGTLGQPVFAARAGRVAIADTTWGPMGAAVIIDHGEGDSTAYGHLNSVLVSLGPVKQAHQIGTVGYSGNASELKAAGLPPHLHFAILKAG